MQKLCCVCTRQQFSASLDYFVTSSPPYLHQFSTISGGNCIKWGAHKCGSLDTYLQYSIFPVGSYQSLECFIKCTTHSTQKVQSIQQIEDYNIEVGSSYGPERVLSWCHFQNMVKMCHQAKMTCVQKLQR